MFRTVLTVAACSALLATSAAAQSSNASPVQALSSCAGAVAAVGNLDVLTHPRGASGEWSDLLGRILAQLNEQEGVEGMTGRYAASAARSFWAEQPRGEREAAANACRERFGAN